MWKSLTLTLLVIAMLVLPLATFAQGDNAFRVWYALPDGNANAIRALAADFARDEGLRLDLTVIDAPYLFDETLAANNAGIGPDVIIASNDDADPLISYGNLIAPPPIRARFFLQDLLTAYPDLAGDTCGNAELGECLWPDLGATVPLITPQARAITVATTSLCGASPWLPFCDGGALMMIPLGWNFTIYLISADWLAEEGLDMPVSAEDVLNLRREYALTLQEAQPGRIQTAQQANFPPVYVLSSTLLATDADAMMASLTSFHDAVYWPVVALNIYGIYVGANAPHAAAAADFVARLANEPEAKATLMENANLLPALTPDEIGMLNARDETRLYTLRALALLTTYASMAE